MDVEGKYVQFLNSCSGDSLVLSVSGDSVCAAGCPVGWLATKIKIANICNKLIL